MINFLEPKNWVSSYADYLLRYAMFRINDQVVCEDLVQDTFFSALKARDNFKGISSEKTWLTSILKNKIIDVYRKKGKNPSEISDEHFYQEVFDESDDMPAHWMNGQTPHLWESDVINKIVTKEYHQILHNCIAKLSENQQAILLDKYFEEKSSEKICKDFNISKSNYWTMMHRVNLKLRKCLEINWVGK